MIFRQRIVEDLASLFGTSINDIDVSVITHLDSYKNGRDLEDFLAAFTAGDQLDSIRSFVSTHYFPNHQTPVLHHRSEQRFNPSSDNAPLLKGRKSILAENSPSLQSKNSPLGNRDIEVFESPFEVDDKKNISSRRCPPVRSRRVGQKKGGPKRGQYEKEDRPFCFCNAQTHRLIGNCLTCGRIVCSEEGEGPCLFCGNDIAEVGSIHPLSLVGPTDELEHDEDVSDVHRDGLNSRLDEGDFRGRELEDDQLKRALEHKNRLLEFERSSVQRTKVYDDSTDWFAESNNQWLSQTDRERAAAKDQEIRELKKDAKATRYLTFDFGAAKVSQETVTIPEDSAEAVDRFLSQARERELQKLPQSNSDFKLFGASVIHHDRSSNEQQQHSPELPLGPNPFLSGTSRDLYDTLRERIQLRQLVRTSQWGGIAKERQMRDERMDSGPGTEHLTNGTDQENSSTTQRWGRSWKTDESDLLMAEDLGVIEKSDGTSTENDVPIDSLIYEQLPTSPEQLPTSSDSDDAGVCLSLHQPWASLLVHGFKRAEGRVWSTTQKGRLWIHAASKEPDPTDIEGLEMLYKDLYQTQTRRVEKEKTGSLAPVPVLPPFPSDYPTSCLLGCVDLIDCMSQSEYIHFRETQPGGVLGREDNCSPFVFVCRNPKRLVLPIQMKGGHKLWQLPSSRLPHFHRALIPALWPLMIPKEIAEPSVVQPLPAQSFDILPETTTAREVRVLNDVVRSIGSLTPDLWKNTKMDISSTKSQNGSLVVIRKLLSTLLQQAVVLWTREMGFQSSWMSRPVAPCLKADISNFVWSIENPSEVLSSFYRVICEVSNNDSVRIESSTQRAHFIPESYFDTQYDVLLTLRSGSEERSECPTVIVCVGQPIRLTWKNESVTPAPATPNVDIVLNSGDVLLIRRHPNRKDALDRCAASSAASVAPESPKSIRSPPSNLKMRSGTLLLFLES